MRCWYCASMTDLEIPYERDRHGHYRFFEILPGALSWFMLCLPFILSYINITLASLFVLVYLLINFTRVFAGAIRALQGYHTMRVHQELPWREMVHELEVGEVADPQAKRPKWHYDALLHTQVQPLLLPPSKVVHAVIVATYKETKDILVPTIKSILASDYDMK